MSIRVNSEIAPVHEPLEPLPYHQKIVDYFKAEEGELWKWFTSAEAQTGHAESLRLELLKQTYRLEPGEHPELYGWASEACRNLGLSIPVTLYQATQSRELNAALLHLPGEAHVVLSGPLLTLLDPMEMQSVLGHELAHYHLWNRDGGEFLIADQLLGSLDPLASASHSQTARRYQLYTEIFADRGALQSTGDLNATVAALVKVHTGLASASGASYLRQADEIFEGSETRSEGTSHPEAFIRARALRLWAERDPEMESKIVAMIEGEPRLEELDLPTQTRLSALTRRLIEQLLRPAWFQTPLTLGHARLFYPDFKPASQDDPDLAKLLESRDAKLNEYLGFVLLDFAVIDPELEDLPLAAAIEWSRRIGIGELFDKLASKELKLKARDFNKLKKEAAGMLLDAK
jgi:Zn-dependent protease with chaperone function